MVPPPLDDALELRRHKFTADEFMRMDALGILDSGVRDVRIELLEGELIEQRVMGDPHIVAVRRLTRLLVPVIGERAWVNVGLPIRASRYSVPYPDISLQPEPKSGSVIVPTPHLVIEVSDKSLRMDRILKQRIYAQAKVPEYWIVNLRELQIEVHEKPRGDDYTNRVVHPRDATLHIGKFPDVEVPFAEILAGL